VSFSFSPGSEAEFQAMLAEQDKIMALIQPMVRQRCPRLAV